MDDDKIYTRKELEKLLKDEHKIFAEARLFNNKVQAYRIAYPNAGYKSASASAAKLLENPRIKQYIEYLKGDIEEITGVSKIRNVQELAKIAYSTIAHYHNTWVDLKVYEDIPEDQKAAIESTETRKTKRKEGIYGDEVEVEEVKIKLFPKIGAMDQINKLMGYYTPEEKNITITPTKVKWGDQELEI